MPAVHEKLQHSSDAPHPAPAARQQIGVSRATKLQVEPDPGQQSTTPQN
jgi:hypothetical protein